MLEGDALKDVRDILTSIGSRLEILVNLFPFDDHDGIRFLFEQQGNGIARQAVSTAVQSPYGLLWSGVDIRMSPANASADCVRMVGAPAFQPKRPSMIWPLCKSLTQLGLPEMPS